MKMMHGRVLLGLLEHVAHAARTDADEHFDEVGTRDREERHVRFARHGARDQRLTGTRRTDEQRAARDAAAEPLELLRIAQEFDDLFQVRLGFVHARDVIKRHAALPLGQKLCAALAEAHGAARARLHLAHEEHPDTDQQQHREPVEQHAHQRRHVLVRGTRLELDALLLKALDQHAVVRRVGGELLPTLAERAIDAIARDRHLADAATIDRRDEFRVGNLVTATVLRRAIEQIEERREQHEHGHPDRKLLKVGVHRASYQAADQGRWPLVEGPGTDPGPLEWLR